MIVNNYCPNGITLTFLFDFIPFMCVLYTMNWMSIFCTLCVCFLLFWWDYNSTTIHICQHIFQLFCILFYIFLVCDFILVLFVCFIYYFLIFIFFIYFPYKPGGVSHKVRHPSLESELKFDSFRLFCYCEQLYYFLL